MVSNHTPSFAYLFAECAHFSSLQMYNKELFNNLLYNSGIQQCSPIIE